MAACEKEMYSWIISSDDLEPGGEEEGVSWLRRHNVFGNFRMGLKYLPP